jgi:hypothetical protein
MSQYARWFIAVTPRVASPCFAKKLVCDLAGSAGGNSVLVFLVGQLNKKSGQYASARSPVAQLARRANGHDLTKDLTGATLAAYRQLLVNV